MGARNSIPEEGSVSRSMLLLAAALIAGAAATASAQTAAPSTAAPAAAAPAPAPRARGAAVFQRLDTNHDGRITQEEYLAVMRQRFDAADVNHDGSLSAEELPAFMRPAGRPIPAAQRDRAAARATAMVRRLDRNGDQRLSFEELQPQMMRWFTGHDANGDGVVTLEEAQATRRRAPAARAQ
jgi:Ca2+-binding EF-hand superfamily protein